MDLTDFSDLPELPEIPRAPARPAPRHIAAPVVFSLDRVAPAAIRWLWPGRIALGKLTLLAGDPGLGKSFLALDIIARVTRGEPWPDQPDDVEGAAAPGGAVLLSAEDDLHDTVRPRLDQVGADLARVRAVDSVLTDEQSGAFPTRRPIDLARDLDALDEAITQSPDCRLVVIDPISAYLPSSDSQRFSRVREVLGSLAKLAERRNVALLAITHLRKSGGGSAIYRSMGSLAFAASARAVWFVTKCKEQPARRLLLPVKNNLSADQDGLGYTIERAGAAGRVVWEDEPVRLTADEAFSGVRERPNSALDDALEWLSQVLADGPRPTKEMIATAKDLDISRSTLRQAKSQLGVVARKRGYGDAAWTWEIPRDKEAPADLEPDRQNGENGENGQNGQNGQNFHPPR